MRQRIALTGFGLKRVAVVSMVIDHVGSLLLRAMLAPYKTGEILTADHAGQGGLRDIGQYSLPRLLFFDGGGVPPYQRPGEIRTADGTFCIAF